jgi:low affinity Fe/Cu permease
MILSMTKRKQRSRRRFEVFSMAATRWTGGTSAFGLALATVIIWALLGPVFRYSTTWQLIINTGTTIITFLMVFLIQRAQNKDSLAVHLKLNELVAAMQGASNRMVDVEALSEEELRTLARHYAELSDLAKGDAKITESHSVEEARNRHSSKKGGR